MVYFFCEVFDYLSEILIVHVLLIVERIDIFHSIVLICVYSKIRGGTIDDEAGLVVGASVNELSIVVYCYGIDRLSVIYEKTDVIF